MKLDLPQEPGKPIQLNTLQDFNKAYANAYQSGKLLVIQFYANWCGPCKRISPFYDEMVAEYPNIIFSRVDGDVGKETQKNGTQEEDNKAINNNNIDKEKSPEAENEGEVKESKNVMSKS